jgi:hypothetical protein
MRSLFVLLPALLAAAPSREVPAAAPAGRPVTCLRTSDIRESLVRSDSVIDFVATGRRVYRVTLPQGCPQLGFERRFGYETTIGQLCSTDIITVLPQTGIGRGASCGLAPFQPVTLARRPRAR